MTRTEWQVIPSFRYDALCLLNTLTGDPFYVEFNQDAYDYFKPRLTAEAETALADLKRSIKDEGKWIISALLCMYYSGTEGETLAEMHHALDDPEPMRRSLQHSPYYDENEWQLFLRNRDTLHTIFRFLEDIDFSGYWQDTILLQIAPEIEKIAAYLTEHDVVAKLEALIGITLPSLTIRVYVLYYTRPHGIKVIGQNFITDASWSPKIALRTAIHEMLHPPYDYEGDKALKTAILNLQQDPFVAEKFAGHNPDYGYNDFPGYVEENCVRALEQIVNESFDIARDPRERWRTEDDGMHVVAAALYHTLKTQQFTGGFRDFLLNALQTSLAPGKVRRVYDAFYGE